MSRRISISLVLVTAAAAAAGLTAGAGGAGARSADAAATPGKTSVQLLKCARGKTPEKRFAIFRGEMTQVDGAERMRMRFKLTERIGSGKRHGVAPRESQTWHESQPGVTRFAYRQKVEQLKEATTYQVTVRFQWLDADGVVLAKAQRRSKTCRQRGKLPNLAFKDVRSRSGPTAGTSHYLVRIHNDGLVAAPRTELVLRVDGTEVDVRPVGRLEPGDRRLIRFVGPACATGVEAQLDPGDLVREIAEADNLIAVPCPSVEPSRR